MLFSKNWTVLLSAPIEAYAMLEDYARAFEVAETMLSPDEQREGLVALLRERGVQSQLPLETTVGDGAVIGQGESFDVQLFLLDLRGLAGDWLTPIMVFFSDALKTLPGRIGAALLWGYLLWRGGQSARVCAVADSCAYPDQRDLRFFEGVGRARASLRRPAD
jgi:hypothetical protein